MPIKTPGGILEVEDAKLRASYLLANTSVGIGTSTTVPDGASLYINEDDPTIRFQEGTSVSAARILAKGGTLRLESGTDYDQPNEPGDIAFSNIQGGTTHMIIKGDGNVGVGTVSPAYTLDVSGNVHVSNNTVNDLGSKLYVGDGVVREFNRHDRPLTKYPEVQLTGYSDGSGYVVDKSSEYNGSTNLIWEVFNDSGYGLFGTTQNGHGFDGTTTDHAYVGSTRLASDIPLGEYVTLALPGRGIKLSYFTIRARPNVESQAPEDFQLYGTNDTSSTWPDSGYELLASFSGQSPSDDYDTVFSVNSSKPYKKFGLVITRIVATSGICSIGDFKLYGTEEGDESVDVVHKSVPNKPGQQHLEVYWDANDTTSYSGSGSTTVTDLSGNGVTGTLESGVGFDTEYKAFTFPGGTTNETIFNSSFAPSGGDYVHSVSVWFNASALDSTYQNLFWFGNLATNEGSFLKLTNNNISWDSVNTGFQYDMKVSNNTWYHAVLAYSGGGMRNHKVYVNGVCLQNPTLANFGTGDGYTNTLNIPTSTYLILAHHINSANKSFVGKIANFRLFSKALNADQVKELYEYDAERFGHRTNVVSLHKGNLGIGVNYPNSRFEVAGREDLQEYPPKAMTGYETYMEGHGVFRASASNEDASYPPWNVFNKDDSDRWQVSNVGYDETTALYGGSNVLSSSSGTPSGEYVILSCPSKVRLQHYSVTPRNSSTYYDHQSPVDAEIWGSEDGSTWTFLHRFIGVSYASQTDTKHYTVSTDKYYSSFALITTKNGGGVDAFEGISIGEWRLFGTPAPSSLEDGHLTLGKALTAPRFTGHAAGAETPRAESLVVHYDTTVDSVTYYGRVIDTSGNGLNGTLSGATYSSSDRALTFDGVNDKVTATFPSSSGDNTFTVSFWMKRAANAATYCPVYIGDEASGEGIGMDIYTGGDVYWFIYGGKNFLWTGVTGVWFPVGSWTHVVASHTAGTDFANLNKVWINGVEVSAGKSLNGTSTSDLSLDSSDSVTLGARGSNHYLNGSISNFKLWNVALTAEEVAAEYALGRTGKSLNITDTAMCLGGEVPRAQLDVRGSMVIDGNVGVGSGNPSQKLEVKGDSSIANTRDTVLFIQSRGSDVVPLINSGSNGQDIKTIAGLEITSIDIPVSGHGRHSYIESVSAGSTYNTDLEFRVRGTDAYYEYGGSSNPTQKQARISHDGKIYARVGTSGTGADYAELFEWDDGNPNNEDRTGMTVQLTEGGKISVANSNTLPEDVIGVVSVIYGFLGNDHWDEWCGKYIKDSLGRTIYETVDMVTWRDENDKEQTFRVNKVPQDLEIPETATYYQDQVPEVNPEYNETLEYVGRGKRKEWSAIGLVGRLRVLKNYPKSSRWIKIQDIDNDVEEYLSI